MPVQRTELASFVVDSSGSTYSRFDSWTEPKTHTTRAIITSNNLIWLKVGFDPLSRLLVSCESTTA